VPASASGVLDTAFCDYPPSSISHFGPKSTVKAVLNFITKPILSRIVFWRATAEAYAGLVSDGFIDL
jgi:hypothetical protein